MCRSSRLTLIILLLVLPSAAGAQFYGFPSEVGVIDDGFGVLPPLPPQAPSPREGQPFTPQAFVEPSGPPPPCPLVIRIGRGLRHSTGTHVVYGRPACS